jgi:photosystem II stability/assembly factor-like uncharacterized protein
VKRIGTLLVIVTALALYAAPAAARPPQRAAEAPERKGLSERLEGMRFRSIGPYRGGRVTAVAGVRGEPRVYYPGATGGGVWRTADAGATWEPISDRDFKTGSVGAIAVAESDPNVVYVGMGEAPIRGNVSHGDGVYKSTDRGRSWRNVGLGQTSQIPRVRVHPRDPNLVYAAALGHVWGSNAERGIFRSKDGGATWEKVLFVSERTGASDLVMDPTNPRVLYAGFWQVHRKPWALVSGGPEGGVWRSTDGGDTWKKLAGGLPEGLVGKVGVAVSPARPDRVWALVEAEKGGLYRSDDAGETWTLVNSDNRLRQRAWYYTRVYADPKTPDTVYVLNVEFMKSGDGGRTFSSIRVPHGDNHDLWIDPDDPERMIESNDGGANVTFNGGQTWSPITNQPTGQFYRVTTDDRFPYYVYGAQQDNTTVAIASRSLSFGIGENDWYPVGGCESGWIAPKPGNPEIVYSGCYGGYIGRYDRKTGQERDIVAWPQLAIGQAPRDLKYRFQWNAPILASRHEPNTLYHAAQVLLRTRDEGQTWEEASPDLTRNDKTKQDYSGGPITRDNTSVETYGTIFALAESPHEAGTMWAGTDDGLVHVTRDGGKTWQNVTPKDMPEWIQINSIEASPHDRATAYVAATMYKHDDFRPYLYKTSDYGRTWKKIVTGIAPSAFTRVVREDPNRRGLLYAGTETGLYVSLDDGASWQPFQRNLPVVPITDLAVKNRDLVVATQGRAFWILDDLTPLHELDDAAFREPLHVFTPRQAVRWDGPNVGEDDSGWWRAGLGRNAPNGVVVYFWLAEKPTDKEPLTVEVLDGETVLKTFTSAKREQGEDAPPSDVESLGELRAGLNRLVWDMRVARPSLLPRSIIWGSTNGPKVGPGTYTIRLKLGSRVATRQAAIVPNPNVAVSAEDLRAQFGLLRDLRDRLSETHGAVRRIRAARDPITGVVARARDVGKGEALEARAKPIYEKLDRIERQLVNPDIKSGQDVLNFPPALDHQVVGIASTVSSADARPTDASFAYYREVKAKLDAVMADLRAVLDADVAAFNEAVRAEGIPPVVVK